MDGICGENSRVRLATDEMTAPVQKILVFQQHGSAERKIQGIRKYGGELFALEVISIDTPLPPIIDEGEDHFPADFQAALVLDFLKHPDLSHDLALLCMEKNIPLVASGKNLRVKGVLTPPT